MAIQSTLAAYRDQQKIIFRAQGFARAHHGLAMRRVGEQELAGGASEVWVDLRDCQHMDSTFLGSLLHLQRVATRCNAGKLALVSPSSQCCRLLQQMGLDDVFPVLTMDAPSAPCWDELCCDTGSMDTFKCQVIEAHQHLAAQPGKCGETFRPVVRGLTQDQPAKKAEPS